MKKKDHRQETSLCNRDQDPSKRQKFIIHHQQRLRKKMWAFCESIWMGRLAECHARWTGIQANIAWSLNSWIAVPLDGVCLPVSHLFQPRPLFTFCHLTILEPQKDNSLPHLTYQVGQEELWAADISTNDSLYWNPRKTERSFSLPELKETRLGYYRTCRRWHHWWGAISSILLTAHLLCPQAEVPLSLQEGSQPLGINGTLFSKEVQDPLLAKAQESIILQDDWIFLTAKNPLNTIHLEKYI